MASILVELFRHNLWANLELLDFCRTLGEDHLDAGAPGIAVLYAAHILTDFGWLSLLSALTAGGRRVLGTAFYRWALALSGLALLGLGGLFLARAASDLGPRLR